MVLQDIFRRRSDAPREARQSGSHKLLARDGWPDYEFAFHDNDELGRRILSRIAKHTGLRPEDL